MAQAKRPPGRPKVKNPGSWNPKWRCTMCGQLKYESEFHARHAKGGPYALRKVQSHCKDCFREYQRARALERRMAQMQGHDDAG